MTPLPEITQILNAVSIAVAVLFPVSIVPSLISGVYVSCTKREEALDHGVKRLANL